ncbi:efflux transporter outer membrane subunit [Polymorphobacter sp. PAMC 29334]|uniref:efflux transporter outer membrane subunit n=1 Tax=Polymorphobacter sp. PAMC 29334 TaxID=2862331 RepID=UPI001C78B5EE|nr:efflux transporter outer membrane subunit [Polymorphobacter sp. PAMC 29334]QYE35121.1 efflux transporter outer membrane subunit [Polymorphobacter sp. PAMC 29334]
MKRVLPIALTAALLASCTVGPNYKRPTDLTPPAFKEAAGWTTAAPGDLLDKGPWWTVFNDPVLNDLCARIEVSNQNVAAAVAAVEQSQALVREARAGYFPTLDITPAVTKSGGGGSNGTIITSGGGVSTTTGTGDTGTGSGTGSTGSSTVGSTGSGARYRLTGGASWEPDLWGRVRRSVEQAKGNAAATTADLAAARLSAQSTLATDYLQMRSLDAQIDLTVDTGKSYDRALQITLNRYNAGVSAKTDLLQAQTQVASTRGDLAELVRQRGVLEHAIAVLTGEAPATFVIQHAAWAPVVPAVPAEVPSTLLQRRPDIAGAERRVAAANAGIGIAVAAFYPNLTLTGSVGQSATSIGSLFNGSAFLWSLGASLAQTVFDGGLIRGQVAAARATWRESVATYRQTVLSALQDTEDQLIGARQLAVTTTLRQAASAAADETEKLTLNQYLAGQVDYTTVVTVQATALTARRTLVTAVANQQATSVSLIRALGGSWETTYRTPPPAG